MTDKEIPPAERRLTTDELLRWGLDEAIRRELEAKRPDMRDMRMAAAWVKEHVWNHHGGVLPEVIYNSEIPPGWYEFSGPRCVAQSHDPHDCGGGNFRGGGYRHYGGAHPRVLILPESARGKPIPAHFLPKGMPPPRAPGEGAAV
jgi:hypothetical protein